MLYCILYISKLPTVSFGTRKLHKEFYHKEAPNNTYYIQYYQKCVFRSVPYKFSYLGDSKNEDKRFNL